MSERSEIAREQLHLDGLYHRLDEVRDETSRRLSDMRAQQVGGNHQHRSERDAFATLYEDQLMRLRQAEDRLAFGRLDFADDSAPVYIGRIGLSDANRDQILMDWRAPASEPFYQATAVNPGNVTRRRHIASARRRVVGLEDDVLDLDGLDAEQRSALSGEGALIAALDARRTGRMSEIVTTIQAEQDRIIRLPLAGTVVVQGGPGTGKTAVALHRAAFLLFKHRERIAKSGVLLVGPSPLFLHYIEQVLPSLGETGAVLTTPGRLFPGLDAEDHDTPAVAALKGDIRMAGVIAKAVADRQRVPAEDQVVTVEGRRLVLSRDMVLSAAEKARRTETPHNEARLTFVAAVLKQLTTQLAEQIAADAGRAQSLIAQDDLATLAEDVRSSRDVRVAVNLAWMPLTPRTMLENLFAKPHWLDAAAPDFTERERDLLLRPKGSPFTVEDVPLLDEIAELIGEEPEASRPRENDSEYARAVVEMTGNQGVVDAGQLQDRFEESAPSLVLSERAAEDRTWTFGHMVVDEAQELSPMMWRLLYRRVPSKSATVVGDLAQSSRTEAIDSWRALLGPVLDERFTVENLTVSYRTPEQIMALANRLLAAHFPRLTPPTSVRQGQWPPEALLTESITDTIDSLSDLVDAELGRLDGGTLALIASDSLVEEVERAFLTDPRVARARTESPVTLVTANEAKGLEFDGVVVIEPGLFGPDAAVGQLYVALTRATRRLTVVGSAPSEIFDYMKESDE